VPSSSLWATLHGLGHDRDVVIVWRRRERVKRRVVAATQDHRGEDLSRARLIAMDLRGKDLGDANLEWADLTECDLSETRLCGANLHGAYLTGARLDHANLSNARLDGAYLLATDFSDALLDGTSFEAALWDQGTTWPAGFLPPRADVGLWRRRRR
jgi:uncharacterized protein YjbI with pentapeptide repeats